MLILPDLTTPDITAKPDLKSVFPGPLKFFFPDLMTFNILTSLLVFFYFKFLFKL